MGLTASAEHPLAAFSAADVWACMLELADSADATEGQAFPARLGRLWGRRALRTLVHLFRTELGQELDEADLGAVLEALGDLCEQSDLGRVSLDLGDAAAGLVHIWQYACPLAGSAEAAPAARSFLEGFHATVLERLASREVDVRWLATDRRRRILRFLAGSAAELDSWSWTLDPNGDIAATGARS
ncbi:MAG: hypothetical protein MI919_09350 [Holophagales bacterium]|nr:hypothetical protein [Holophagales bacterium]